MNEGVTIHNASAVDLEIANNGTVVAMRVRSEQGAPSYAALPIPLLMNLYVGIPRVLGLARDARIKAGIAETPVTTLPPQVQTLTRIDVGMQGDKAVLVLELNNAMSLAVQADPAWLKNAMQFTHDRLAEAEKNPPATPQKAPDTPA
jgi:hypothetical protein